MGLVVCGNDHSVFAGSIVIGFIAKMKESAFINSFIQGAGDLLGVAFIIGLARGITILMNDGLISDSILFYASEFTTGMNKGVFVNVLFFIYQGLTFSSLPVQEWQY